MPSEKKKDGKQRLKFYLLDSSDEQIGYGNYYPYGGNCQVYLKSQNYAAVQHANLADVLRYEGVRKFEWVGFID